MRENRTYGSEGGVSRWLIPTPIADPLPPYASPGDNPHMPDYRRTCVSCGYAHLLDSTERARPRSAGKFRM